MEHSGKGGDYSVSHRGQLSQKRNPSKVEQLKQSQQVNTFPRFFPFARVTSDETTAQLVLNVATLILAMK